MMRATITLLLAASLGACGQKGPLVLPDTHTRVPVPVSVPAGTADPAQAAPPSAAPLPTDPATEKKKKPQ